MYINDIAKHLLSLARLFPDDSSLFYSAAHIADIVGIIYHDLQLFTNWANKWLVTFNPLKTEAVLFTFKKLDFIPQLVFDNIPISSVDSHKHLGVTLRSNWQWHSNVENILDSASMILALMRKLKYSISRNVLNQMYMSYLPPVVEYASVVWDGCSERDSQTLQNIQNEVVHLVTGLTRSVLLENLYKECGWLTLSQRRQQHKLSFMHNVNAGLLLLYISDLIPPLVSEILDCSLRNKRNIHLDLGHKAAKQTNKSIRSYINSFAQLNMTEAVSVPIGYKWTVDDVIIKKRHWDQYIHAIKA